VAEGRPENEVLREVATITATTLIDPPREPTAVALHSFATGDWVEVYCAEGEEAP
jgi:hypothetical protein